MIAALRNFSDRIRGVGKYSITVPPLDGALRPNQDLEEAETLVAARYPGHLCVQNGDLWFASGTDLMRMKHVQAAEVIERFGTDITAMALSPSGDAAVALADGNVSLPQGFAFDGLTCNLRCITSLAFDENGNCLVACGSEHNSADDWARDLLEHGASGSVWRIPRGNKAQCLAKGLAWPTGVLALAGGDILVSEASAARIARIKSGGATEAVLTNLPGYPACVSHSAAGGYHLAIMAPRNQLIEFIMRERDFLRDMIANTAKEHWIAPSLYPPQSFLEPLQGGALKQLGIMKPWAPSRSIGLVVRLNGDFVVTGSHHSRADGRNHGTTSCVEWRGALIVASRGNHCLLRLPMRGEKQ